MVTDFNDTSTVFKRRIFMANRCFYGLRRHLASRVLSKKTKAIIFKTLLRPVLTYGSECWVLSKKDEMSLLVFERKILRKIFGPVQENGVWRIRYNEEVYNIYNEPNIMKTIKIGRLRWAGHVERMSDESVPKKILHTKPQGRRSVGRPKLRWLDGVQRDIEAVGIRDWRSTCQDRRRWRLMLEEAKAHNGL